MAEEKENFDTEAKEEETPPVEEEKTEEKKAEEEPQKEEAKTDDSNSPSEGDEEPSKPEKKKKKPAKKKDPRDEQIAELTDKVKRQLAEFENFRTRSEKEKQQRYDMGASFIIEKMLPILDNFERGLVDAPDDAFAEGMKMIHKQMLTALDEAGVKPIEALGQEFNPEYHNAVMQAEATDEYPSGTVAQELQKGYTYHDTVVRHSMVAVSQ
ncbi:MAG: nucleotide exchange factor GrpE [Lachnospiraceae bacterium]|nr:nucleotide exchange factor GrpE [Lachnospiraceae bacterium]